MIASVDESVGRVVATLDELGLADNTLVIFSSDNGGVGGYERAGLNKGGITDNAPLKGGKGMLYEGGIRVPYIFRWTGKIAARPNERHADHSVDLYPTLVEVAGAEAPADYPLDGVSYAPLLTGEQKHARPRRHLLALPRLPRRRRRTNGARRPSGASAPATGSCIEFFEDGQAGTLQPEGRHRRGAQPRAREPREGQRATRKDSRLARGSRREDADATTRRQAPKRQETNAAGTQRTERAAKPRQKDD